MCPSCDTAWAKGLSAPIGPVAKLHTDLGVEGCGMAYSALGKSVKSWLAKCLTGCPQVLSGHNSSGALQPCWRGQKPCNVTALAVGVVVEDKIDLHRTLVQDYELSRFHFLELSAYVMLASLLDVCFSSLSRHAGTPPIASPGQDIRPNCIQSQLRWSQTLRLSITNQCTYARDGLMIMMHLSLINFFGRHFIWTPVSPDPWPYMPDGRPAQVPKLGAEEHAAVVPEIAHMYNEAGNHFRESTSI
ncbi:hypothetical protein GGG16DRAFT_106617 [Schizophyllum commune]